MYIFHLTVFDLPVNLQGNTKTIKRVQQKEHWKCNFLATLLLNHDRPTDQPTKPTNQSTNQLRGGYEGS